MNAESGIGTQEGVQIGFKPGPHAAMLHICDVALQTPCDVSKLHAICCDGKFNMLNILLLI